MRRFSRSMVPPADGTRGGVTARGEVRRADERTWRMGEGDGNRVLPIFVSKNQRVTGSATGIRSRLRIKLVLSKQLSRWMTAALAMRPSAGSFVVYASACAVPYH